MAGLWFAPTALPAMGNARIARVTPRMVALGKATTSSGPQIMRLTLALRPRHQEELDVLRAFPAVAVVDAVDLTYKPGSFVRVDTLTSSAEVATEAAGVNELSRRLSAR
jgi:hypothetical protein